LRSIFGTIKDNNERRIKYNYKLYVLLEDMDIINFIKVSTKRWAGHVVRMDQRKECLTPNQKTEGKEEVMN
jgi:hypothetical protein